MMLLYVELALYMHALEPARSEEDFLRYVRLGEAIESATTDPQEAFVLARIAWFESHFREDVVTCKKLGSVGDRSAWQVVPRGPADAKRLCKSIEGDAKLALERLRESVRACRHLPPPERLAIYTRGRCDSVEGRRLSRNRWVSVPSSKGTP